MGITRYNYAKTMVIRGITMARNYISWDMDGYGALFLVELHLFFINKKSNYNNYFKMCSTVHMWMQTFIFLRKCVSVRSP